ncbi:ImmA/IrrE family metallo-endopeptidase [Frankia sp. AgB1.9]|nr:ImmA/IrrE family metallo-endopeptidase [Frankia sp. AgW1.1]MBL7553028.1 ImmA/IrrE family metallo-endopeptidase [Frankia sp. AgB1.9]
MTDLAGEAVSQAFVSKAEAGRLAVSGDRLDLYAAALHYPIEVLCTDPEVHGVGFGLVYHRRRASLGAKALRRVHAELMFTRSQLRALQTAVGPTPHRFYRADRGPMDIPTEIAQHVRKEWGLPSGPIGALVGAVEAAGGLVVARDLDADGLDAVTQWSGDEPPLFLIDLKAPTDRFRFSLAHEIGHVFLHGEVGGGPEIEQEADEFASELLLPADEIRGSFSGSVDLALLIELKHYWGASMAALVRRALTLGAISDWQYRQIMIEMSALGYRTREPGTLPSEPPRLVRHLAQQLVASTGSAQAAAARIGLLPDEFHDLYLSPGGDADPVEPS